MIFAVFDVLLAVNMCINYSFFYIYYYNVAVRSTVGNCSLIAVATGITSALLLLSVPNSWK